MSKIPAINEIDANSPSQESKEVVVKATDVSPDINEVQETISSAATIQEVDGTRKPTISEIYKIVTDGLFESTSNWWDYAYKLSQAQINQDIISRLDKGEIGGGYSKGVDIITTTKDAIPTNTNVYSALKSDTLYPKKLNNETINGIYNFVNGITIGNPTAYTGGTWSVDQLGKTHLSTDYLYVRLKAIFETLQILNVDTIGGKLVISPAGSITIVYVDNIKVTIDDNEQNVYRCYFLGEQEGEEIENKWKVGDQAQAKSFNVKKGTYHKIGNHYLWRLVVGASTDTVTIDGKKYHYVDLSQLIFDVGSDAPAPGDVLNQLGHRGDDLQRQTAIVLNAVDNYAPSITLYAGINDFTLLNKEYVEYGVYQGKAFFNVYGDMYIGDKGSNPTTYIKYKNGKIDIKANLTIGSSIDGKDLDKYIKENGGVDENTIISLINNSQVIKDLQSQADGAIETWFYEGEPTLKNLPAVNWTTNELKKVHTGDLYYDKNTGFAYRFTKYNDDINPYAWNRIKDNDIVKAFEAASKAQATADSKMKIFYGEAKPTDYQAGDMWVNATLAGKFDNDIARSTTTSKTFDANHWVLASRYSEAIQNLLNWSNQYTTKFEDLTKVVKEQKDKSISNWFYDYEPTIDNEPANLWNTEELRSEHIGDIFYDTKNNHSYRWTGSAWSMIKDADFDEAMKKAKDAEDLADKKRQIFYSDTTPTGGDRGDLWMKQVGTKTEVWVFDGTNWVKSNDKALADYSDAVNKEIKGIKGQLDGKAETWYQADDPSTNWTNKTSHEGDIWYNTTDGTTQYWNGTKWEKMDIPKDVFDTIDGKSSIFVDSYDDAKAGKGVISNGYNERDIWILPADAIVNGVQYYKGDILTATADGTVFNEKHWTKKVRYVGDKELTTAIDKVNKKINDISATTLPGLDNKFNEFAKDGIIDSSEKSRLTDLLNQANNDVLAANDQITSIIKSDYLTNDNVNKGKLIEAQKTLSTAWNEYKTLINTLIASEDSITKNNIAEASSKYTNLQNSIKAVKQYLAACQADMLSNIGIDINSYKYLKEAFKGKTEINGGLVVTNVLQLRQTSDVNSPITAGISGLQGKANENGVVDKDTYDVTSIAAWFGGPMVDKNIFTNEQLAHKVAGTDYARSLFRHDGSGYLASGAIYWGTDGILHGNPNSFILQGTSLATMFNYIRLFYLHYGNNQGEGITGVDYITPTKTFSRLDILTQGDTEAGLNLPTGLFIGSSTTGGSFQVGNIIIRTKDGDPNILEIVSATNGKTAHLGVQGGISAYGTYTSSTGGGGGLNVNVVSYANIIAGNYNDADLTTIPNAYSIKALYNAILNIDVTGQLGNYLLKTDAANTYQPKGNYLTAHQSLDGYINDIVTSGSGNAITSVTKSGKTVTFTKGATYLTTHQSLAAYATQNWVKNEATAHNADMVDNYHASGLFTGFSISDVANKVTISIGGTSKTLNLVRAFPSGVGNNFNDIATHGNSMGMSNIAAPYTSSTANYQTLNGYVNPNGQTGCHHYINLSYTDSNNTATSPNMWQTQFAIKAGTTEVYVRSRAGGKISNDAAWAAPWVRLARVTDNVASASKVANALSWSGYSSGSYNGSAAKSISIPNNTNQLTNGAGFITASASITGNAGSATKLQNARTINGTSFNGTANIVTSYWGTTRKLWGNSVNGNADVNGSITIANTDGVYVQIGDVRLVYDEANTAIKVVKSDGTTAANFYATGGVSAYGVGTSSSSGGGLNGSVKAYADAIRLTTENISEIASAYSVAKLYSEIQNVASAVPSISVSVPTGGNALTGATYDASTGVITFAKGTFLTAHQSLDGYVNAIAVSGSGNAVTAVTKSGKTITFTKGATYLTSHQSLSNYYTKSSVDSLLNGKSATTHTHSVKINGITKTIAASGGDAVDLGTYLTSHQSLNGYATQSWVKSQGYLTSHQDVSVLTIANDRYYNSGQWGINMKNSDIIGVNSIYTNDASETPTEAILFFRSNGNYDGIRASNGVLYFSNNVVRTTSKYDAEYEVYHKGNLTKLSQLTNDKNFVTGSVSGQTITINGVSTTWQNTWRGITDSYSETSTGTSLSQKGANSLYNALHNGYASSAGNADTVDGYHATSGRTFDGNINWSSNWKDTWSDGTNTHPWYGFDNRYPNTGAYSTTLSDYFGMTIKTGNTLRLDFRTLLLNGTNIYNINVNGADTILGTSPQIAAPTEKNSIYVSSPSYSNNKPVKMLCFDWYGNYWAFSNIRSSDTNSAGFGVFFKNKEIARFTSDGNLSCNAASATKLKTARSIWGQSFDGTGNVSGSITGVDNITMSNNSYLYGKNTSGTAIQLIAMASWNSIDIGRGALVNKYTTQVMGKTIVLTVSDDNGNNTKSVELSTAKVYSNVSIETEGGFLAHGGVTAYSSSDIRLKQNLHKLNYLNIIKTMGGSYGFTWRKDNKHSIGWIAQHVLTNPYMRDIVETDENGYYKINYWSPKLIATAFGAIEQVDDEVSKLKARVKHLEAEVKQLTNDNKLLISK